MIDDKGDVEMKNSEDKVDAKKISANDKKTKKEEKMDTEGKEEPNLGGEDKTKAENKEENMETEDREMKQDVINVNEEVGLKESKEKAAITKEEKMDTSDGPIQCNKDKAVDSEADKNVNSVKSEDSRSKNKDSNRDTSSSSTEKQTTGKEKKSGIVPKTEEKSNVEESVGETETKDKSQPAVYVTRKTLKHAEPCDPNPKDKKQAKM